MKHFNHTITALLLLKSCESTLHSQDLSFPNRTLTRIAFGSCHNKKYSNPSIWNSIRDTIDPELWIWTGDSVYPPKGVASMDALAYEYQQMKENKTLGYKNFLEETKSLWGVFGTWDDHDYGANDHGKRMPNRKERANLFRHFLGLSPIQRDGLYSSVIVGSGSRKVKLVLLDTRWFRDDHCIPSIGAHSWIPLSAGLSCFARWITAGLFPQWCSKQGLTMLGDEQWQWLEDQLDPNVDEGVAPLTILVSSVQVLTTNPTMEGWGHFPKERDRLIRLAASLSAKSQVFILSGDVHHGEILDPLPGKMDSFLEVTSSGLTHDCSAKLYGKLCKPLLHTFHKHRHAHIHK